MRSWSLAAGAALLIGSAAACTIDFDRFDPTLADAATSGVGGQGGGTTTGSTAATGGSGGCTPGTARSCYDGPAGTEGVGVCQPGVEICQPDGMTYGACLGVVGPRHETCHTPQDDDCDGVANDHCGSTVGIFGDASAQFVSRIRAAPMGNVLVVGFGYGSMDFGGGAFSGTSGGGYAVQFDAAGDFLWDIEVDGSGFQEVTDGVVTTDATFLTGFYDGTAGFGGAVGDVTTTGADDGFVARYDDSQQIVWLLRIESTGDARPRVLVEGASGEIYVGGEFAGSATFNPGGSALPASATNADAFVMRVDATTGTIDWLETFGASGNDRVLGLAIDSQGDVIVGGVYDAATTIGTGGTPLPAPSNDDGFVAKLSPTGAHIWSHAVAGSGDLSVSDVTVAENDNVVAVGHFTGDIDSSGTTVPAVDGEDGFVRKYASNGSTSWTQLYGGPANQSPRDVVHVGDTLYVGVDHEQTADYGSTEPVVSAGQDDMLVLALDNAGATQWVRAFGSTEDQDVGGIAEGPGGSLWLGGSCAGFINFGDGAAKSQGDDGVCLGTVVP